MRKQLLTIFILFLFTTCFSQVTVTINNLTNANTGQAISSIVIPFGGSIRVTFTIQMSKSSQYVVNGNLYLYTKQTTNSNPVSRSGPWYIVNSAWTGGTAYTVYGDILLYASDFNASGGTLYAKFVSDTGPSYSSSNKPITVTSPPITNNGIGNSQTIYNGTAPSPIIGTTPSGGNGSYSYSWQKNSDGSFITITGVNTKDYSPGNLNVTTSYKRIVTSGTASNSTSNTVTITVVNPPPISNNTINGTQTINEGSIPAILEGSSPTGGIGTYSYQWQMKGTGNWYDISGATSQSYSPEVMTYTTSFRRIVNSGSAQPTISNEITVSVVTYPSITNNFIAFDGVSTIIGTVPQGGNGQYLYQYYIGEEESGIEYRTAFTSNKDFIISQFFLSASEMGRVTVVRNVKSVNKISTSHYITIEIGKTDISNNTILFDGTSFIAGSTPTGSSGIYNYSWEFIDNATGVPTALPGQTGKDLSVPIFYVMATELDVHMRRIVTSGSKISYSDWISVLATNIPDISNNTITFDGVSFVTGSTPSGGLGGYTYRWEYFENATLVPTVLSGQTGKDLSVPLFFTTATELDTYVRRIVTSAAGSKISSSDWISVLADGSSGRRASTSTENIPVAETNMDQEQNVVLYPNPTIDKVTFSVKGFGHLKITVYNANLNAVKVYEGNIDGTVHKEWSVPTNFPKGIYFYKVSCGDKILRTGKFNYK